MYLGKHTVSVYMSVSMIDLHDMHVKLASVLASDIYYLHLDC